MRQNEREPNYHVMSNAIDQFPKETILAVYKKMAEARAFEHCIVRAGKTGRFKIKVHMSSGQEAVSAALSVSAPTHQYFIQHRSMDIFLAMGGPPEELRDEMMCLDTGCCGGKIGGAFQLHRNGRDVYTHTGFIGENISVGVGAALGNGRNTICLFGDGAAEEDYALTAYGFAATHNLPVLFVCTDNDLSVLSPLAKRRTWSLTEVAAGLGIEAIDMADDPFSIMQWIKDHTEGRTALMNIRVCRNFWHAGLGMDSPPAWDRFLIIQEQLKERGWEKERMEIDRNSAERMEVVWEKYL